MFHKRMTPPLKIFQKISVFESLVFGRLSSLMMPHEISQHETFRINRTDSKQTRISRTSLVQSHISKMKIQLSAQNARWIFSLRLFHRRLNEAKHRRVLGAKLEKKQAPQSIFHQRSYKPTHPPTHLKCTLFAISWLPKMALPDWFCCRERK